MSVIEIVTTSTGCALAQSVQQAIAMAVGNERTVVR
jgi:hypothetical protein